MPLELELEESVAQEEQDQLAKEGRDRNSLAREEFDKAVSERDAAHAAESQARANVKASEAALEAGPFAEGRDEVGPDGRRGGDQQWDRVEAMRLHPARGGVVARDDQDVVVAARKGMSLDHRRHRRSVLGLCQQADAARVDRMTVGFGSGLHPYLRLRDVVPRAEALTGRLHGTFIVTNGLVD